MSHIKWQIEARQRPPVSLSHTAFLKWLWLNRAEFRCSSSLVEVSNIFELTNNVLTYWMRHFQEQQVFTPASAFSAFLV